jgi:ligand-binding sensor domain-containing protein
MNLPTDSLIESTEFKETQTKITKTEAAKYGNIHRALRDKAGILWFATTGEGVYRYDGKTFTHFSEKDGLNSNYISAILEDKSGNIWFGTNAGLSSYDGKKFNNFPLGIMNGNYFNTYKPSNDPSIPPPKNAVWSIMQGKSGKIWFGTWQDGVYCYDGKKFTHFLHNDSVVNKNNIKLDAVNSIVEDKNGNIWFATWFEGLCRYDGKEIISYKTNGEVWYSFILKDKNENLWIGRRTKGIMLYDGKSFKNIVQGGTLDSCGVSPLLQDKSGKIWFGSIHSNMGLREKLGGLWSYDGKTFKNYTTKDGLGNNNIWSAVEDKDGNIWFGARNYDLFKYDGNSFINFSE